MITAQFGKCHEVPPWQTSPIGPFDAWPTGGGGFEYFYGFIGGESNQYYPALYEGTTPVEPERTPEQGYHLTEDLADRAIDWVRTQEALAPDKPFFVYFAPGATHAPHHVPAEWADRYAGKFAGGWDAQREATIARQKELGVVSADAELTPAAGRDPGVGRDERCAETGAGTADGGLCRVPGAHGFPGGPTHRRDGIHRRAAPTGRLALLRNGGQPGHLFPGLAVTRHSTPWLPNEELPALDDDVWELYDGRTDWTQARDLVADHPDKLAALQ